MSQQYVNINEYNKMKTRHHRVIKNEKVKRETKKLKGKNLLSVQEYHLVASLPYLEHYIEACHPAKIVAKVFELRKILQ